MDGWIESFYDGQPETGPVTLLMQTAIHYATTVDPPFPAVAHNYAQCMG